MRGGRLGAPTQQQWQQRAEMRLKEKERLLPIAYGCAYIRTLSSAMKHTHTHTSHIQETCSVGHGEPFQSRTHARMGALPLPLGCAVYPQTRCPAARRKRPPRATSRRARARAEGGKRQVSFLALFLLQPLAFSVLVDRASAATAKASPYPCAVQREPQGMRENDNRLDRTQADAPSFLCLSLPPSLSAFFSLHAPRLSLYSVIVPFI